MSWSSIEKVLYGVVKTCAVLVTFWVVALIFMQVIFRFVLHISVPWTEEVARAFYIWIVFIGVVLVERDDSQIRTTLLLEALPVGVHLVLEIVIRVLQIGFNLILFYGSILALGSETGFLSSLPHISLKIFYIPMLIGIPCEMSYQIVHLKHAKSVIYRKREVGQL